MNRIQKIISFFTPEHAVEDERLVTKVELEARVPFFVILTLTLVFFATFMFVARFSSTDNMSSLLTLPAAVLLAFGNLFLFRSGAYSFRVTSTIFLMMFNFFLSVRIMQNGGILATQIFWIPVAILISGFVSGHVGALSSALGYSILAGTLIFIPDDFQTINHLSNEPLYLKFIVITFSLFITAGSIYYYDRTRKLQIERIAELEAEKHRFSNDHDVCP